MKSAEFTALMHRFYAAATDVLVKTDAFIDKLVGDAVFGIYLPAFAGSGKGTRLFFDLPEWHAGDPEGRAEATP